MIEPSEITGVILCGGEGWRMNRQDKPLQLLAGLALVEHVRARLRPQVQRIMISANRNLSAYRAWGDTVFPDEQRGMGPLGGVLTAMTMARTPYLFCCPGDSPLLSLTIVKTLSDMVSLTGADVCGPHDGERPQQLFLLMKTALQHHLRAYLDGGGRSVIEWVETLSYDFVDASNEKSTFLNINTEHDRQAIEDRLLIGSPSHTERL